MVALLPDCSLLHFPGGSFLGIETQQNDTKWHKKKQHNDSKWCNKPQYTKTKHRNKGDGVDENQDEMDRKWRKQTTSSEDRIICNSPLHSCLYFYLSHCCNYLLHVNGLK